MNPITHLLAAWTFSEKATPDPRDRNLTAWAGVLPDLDGLGWVWDSGRMILGISGLGYYETYHHSLFHGLWGALGISAILAFFSRRRLRVAVLSFFAVHLHLLLDVVGSRGPNPGDLWPIGYLSPFSERWTIVWPHQWPLNSWPNIAFTLMLLGTILGVAIRRGTSAVGMFSNRADAKVVEVLRLRWARIRGKGERTDS